MDDIAKHLGISKKTIYRFFNDKDTIVHRLMKQRLEEHEKEFDEIAKTAANIVEEVFAIMENLSAILSQSSPSMFYDLQKYYPASWKLFKEFKEKYILKMVENTLEKGIRDGYVRKDVNTRILAKLRVEQIEMGFDPTVFPPDKFKILEIQLELIQHFLYGICTIRGHKLINKHKDVVDEE